MKKLVKIILIIVLAVIVLGLIVLGSFIYYKNYKQQEQNNLFARDVIHSLVEIRASREDTTTDDKNTDEKLQSLTEAYGMKEHIMNAKNDIEKWDNSNNKKIKAIADNMLDGINNLLVASEAYIKFNTEGYQSQAENLAIFKVNLDEGRKKIMAASAIGLDKDFSLSTSQKKDLISYIDNAFKEDEEKRQEYINKGEEDFALPQEFWAVLFIKGGLENSIK